MDEDVHPQPAKSTKTAEAMVPTAGRGDGSGAEVAVILERSSSSGARA